MCYGKNQMSDVRIDKWLWAARFFKSRTLAAAACNGGKVHVNGDAAKPSKAVRPGDRLRLRLTVGKKRLSSRGNRGHVESLHELIRQDGAPVFSVDLALLIATRRSE